MLAVGAERNVRQPTASASAISDFANLLGVDALRGEEDSLTYSMLMAEKCSLRQSLRLTRDSREKLHWLTVGQVGNGFVRLPA